MNRKKEIVILLLCATHFFTLIQGSEIIIEKQEKQKEYSIDDLISAVKKPDNEVEIIKTLKYVAIDSKNKFGLTALMSAVQVKNNINNVKLLLDNGADISILHYQGGNSLIFAVYLRENENVVKLLLEYGIDVNYKNNLNNNITALMHAVYTPKNTNIFKILLDYEAHLDFQDNNGNTALMHAVLVEKNIDNIKFLLDHGANMTIKNNNNETALLISNKKRYANTSDLLQEAHEEFNNAVYDIINNNIAFEDFLNNTKKPAVWYLQVKKAIDKIVLTKKEKSVIKTFFKNLATKIAQEEYANLHESFFLYNMKALFALGLDVNEIVVVSGQELTLLDVAFFRKNKQLQGMILELGGTDSKIIPEDELSDD